MISKFSKLRVLALMALFAGCAALAHAQGQVYVLESSADTVKAGTVYGLGDRITIPAGTSVRAVMPSGKTQTIKGPFSGSVADLTKGQKVNEGILSWIKNLLQTGGANDRIPGATRSMRAPEPPATFSWTAVPSTMDSTVCIQKGAALQLRRAPSQRVERITVIDSTTSAKGEVEFAAGSDTAPWPSGVTLRPDAMYAIIADGRPRRQVTLRMLDGLPGEDDILAELFSRECRYQFDAYMKGKLAAAKKAS